VGALGGAPPRQLGQPVELGFLLGTRKYECNVERFPAGAELHIHASRSLQDDNGMGVFECQLRGPGIEALARLNVFRPPQVASYLQEEFQGSQL
jgi:predicted hotdog family 3-hydroxylacyl-ACP dehydratase